MDLYAATRVYTGRGLRRVVSGNHPGPMLVYTATRGQPRVPEQPSEWWASCTPRVILAQWKSVAYPQELPCGAQPPGSLAMTHHVYTNWELGNK
ncbi:uncharacterized protein LOC111863799 isoform X11 [Cryptotermes secundus]|uniref:uncharacterized protein LOC111863799 isoform X11 n=1 Tax=Cryptotermes secundus TaxID=105785 RepID=UPI001454B99E|nr:uncharacterized protein LOC111863799 isoform X11 [Cryptotermes secundus]XP_033607067.1 uncharacterized protein LOC111863799 isoform X11 [Cryptotermes secundus]